MWGGKLVAQRPYFEPHTCLFSPIKLCVYLVTCQHFVFKIFLIKTWPGSWASPHMATSPPVQKNSCPLSRDTPSRSPESCSPLIHCSQYLSTWPLEASGIAILPPLIFWFPAWLFTTKREFYLGFQGTGLFAGSYSCVSTSTTIIHLLCWAFPKERQEEYISYGNHHPTVE